MFAATAIATLALGIGANTAIFSLLNAVMLKTLPVRDPAQLILFGEGSWEPALALDQRQAGEITAIREDLRFISISITSSNP